MASTDQANADVIVRACLCGKALGYEGRRWIQDRAKVASHAHPRVLPKLTAVRDRWAHGSRVPQSLRDRWVVAVLAYKRPSWHIRPLKDGL